MHTLHYVWICLLHFHELYIARTDVGGGVSSSTAQSIIFTIINFRDQKVGMFYIGCEADSCGNDLKMKDTFPETFLLFHRHSEVWKTTWAVTQYWLKCSGTQNKMGGYKAKVKKVQISIHMIQFRELEMWLFPTFFSRSSFSFVQEASYWLFSVVATFNLLFRDSMRAFLLVASSVNVLSCGNSAKGKKEDMGQTTSSKLSTVDDSCCVSCDVLCVPSFPSPPPFPGNFSQSPAGFLVLSSSPQPAAFSWSHLSLNGLS